MVANRYFIYAVVGDVLGGCVGGVFMYDEPTKTLYYRG
jgi:hypothetical protein